MNPEEEEHARLSAEIAHLRRQHKIVSVLSGIAILLITFLPDSCLFPWR